MLLFSEAVTPAPKPCSGRSDPEVSWHSSPVINFTFPIRVSEIARTKLSNRKVVPLWLLLWWISEGDKKNLKQRETFLCISMPGSTLMIFDIFSFQTRLISTPNGISTFFKLPFAEIGMNKYKWIQQFAICGRSSGGRWKKRRCLQVKWNSNPSTRIDFSYTSSGSF